MLTTERRARLGHGRNDGVGRKDDRWKEGIAEPLREKKGKSDRLGEVRRKVTKVYVSPPPLMGKEAAVKGKSFADLKPH